MTSAKFVEHDLGLSHSSTVNFNHYLREVCAWTLIQNPVRIGAPNMDVEIDESLFTRRKKSPRKSFTTAVGVWWLLRADQTMFHVSCRRQNCCNVSSNNCTLCSPRFKCPLRFMASVHRCWRNWLPTLHNEPFIERCGFRYWFAYAKR